VTPGSRSLTAAYRGSPEGKTWAHTCLVSSEHEPSWRLKIARAEQHLVELRDLVERYQNGHYYRAVCPNPPRQPTHWRFVLEITQEPDPQLAIVLGDLLFNVRSALDHVAVACAPPARKRQAGFPLYEVLDDDAQRKFESMTRDMAPGAVAAIEYEQPYNAVNRTSKIGPESVEALFALNALQDADKHRSLAVLVAGISNPRVQVTGGGETFGTFRPTYVEPGALLISYDEFGNRIPFDEVTVEVRGVPHVAVNVSRRGDYELLPAADGIVGRVRDRVIPSLEPFVRV
jgi:hypothetical protein